MHVVQTATFYAANTYVAAYSVTRHIGRPVPAEMTLRLSYKQSFRVEYSEIPLVVYLFHFSRRRQHFYDEFVTVFFQRVFDGIRIFQEHIFGFPQKRSVQSYFGEGIYTVKLDQNLFFVKNIIRQIKDVYIFEVGVRYPMQILVIYTEIRIFNLSVRV